MESRTTWCIQRKWKRQVREWRKRRCCCANPLRLLQQTYSVKEFPNLADPNWGGLKGSCCEETFPCRTFHSSFHSDAYCIYDYVSSQRHTYISHAFTICSILVLSTQRGPLKLHLAVTSSHLRSAGLRLTLTALPLESMHTWFTSEGKLVW